MLVYTVYTNLSTGPEPEPMHPKPGAVPVWPTEYVFTGIIPYIHGYTGTQSDTVIPLNPHTLHEARAPAPHR